MPDYSTPYGGGFDNTDFDKPARVAAAPPGLGRWLASTTSRNTSPFLRGIPPEVAFDVRKKAKRAYAPPMAALQAANQLYNPSIDLARRGGIGYADLFSEIAPRYAQGFRDANPETAGLLSQLTADASSLTAPGYTNPYEDRMLQQSIRGAQSARGLAFGEGAALEELLGLDRSRESRRIARGQYGASIADAGNRFYAPGILGTMSQYQNPYQPTSTSDLLSISINDTQSRRNEQAARHASNQQLWGTIIGSVLGAAGGAAGACWVAEELYGVNDIRTHLARAWVGDHPTNRFVQLYQKQGKAWARWLSLNQWAKPIVQPIWDSLWQRQAGLIV